MAIDSVSSSTSVPAKPVQQPKPEQVEARKQQAAGSADESSKPRPVEQQAKTPEPPKPVVNTEGQKTGQVINVTA